MACIDSAQNFVGTIGPVAFKGYLFLTEPRSDSFAQGTAEMMGIASFFFSIFLADPPLEFHLSNFNVTIIFDLDLGALRGDVHEDQNAVCRAKHWKTIASLPSEFRT